MRTPAGRPTRVETISLGPSEAVAFHEGSSLWAIVLPGAGYSGQAPLLWYARRAAQAAGRNTLVVTDRFSPDRADPVQWVEERTEAALDYVRREDPHPVLIAKSLTSLAARIAARDQLPAIWLTPLIAERGTSVAADVLAGLRQASAPMLLVGGTEDPTWDREVASALAGETLELPRADHSLEVPGDVATSLAYLRLVTEAVAQFLRARPR